MPTLLPTPLHDWQWCCKAANVQRVCSRWKLRGVCATTSCKRSVACLGLRGGKGRFASTSCSNIQTTQTVGLVAVEPGIDLIDFNRLVQAVVGDMVGTFACGNFEQCRSSLPHIGF